MRLKLKHLGAFLGLATVLSAILAESIFTNSKDSLLLSSRNYFSKLRCIGVCEELPWLFAIIHRFIVAILSTIMIDEKLIVWAVFGTVLLESPLSSKGSLVRSICNRSGKSQRGWVSKALPWLFTLVHGIL
ncbi:hypothetical protein BRM12_00035, partial [Xanthomonas oryzae pv. oryzae]